MMLDPGNHDLLDLAAAHAHGLAVAWMAAAGSLGFIYAYLTRRKGSLWRPR